MYTADGYFFGLLLAVLSVYLAVKAEKFYKLAAASVLLGLSMSFYQSYVSVAILLLEIWLILMLNDREKSLKDFWKKTGSFALMGVMAIVVYYPLMKIVMKITGHEVSGYMGLDGEYSFSIGRVVDIIVNSYVEFARFFLVRWEVNFYNTSNVILLLSIVALILWICGKRKLFAQPWRILLMLVWALLLPVVTHIYSFISEGVSYISIIMCYSMVLIYLMPLILWQEATKDTGSFGQWLDAAYVRKHFLQTLQSVLLVCICVHFVVIADQAYERMHLANEQLRNLVNRIQYRMEMQEGYTDTMEVALYGNLYQEPEYVPSAPMMPGVVSGRYLSGQQDFSSAIDWFASSEHTWATVERRKELVHTEEFAQMEPWPAESCVRVIDGTMVILLSEGDADEFGQTIKDYLEE